MKRKIIGTVIIALFLFIAVGIPMICMRLSQDVENRLGESDRVFSEKEKERRAQVAEEEVENFYWDMANGTGMKVANLVHGKLHAQLEDKIVAECICKELADDSITPENITWDEVEEVKSLTMIYSAKCNTIKDIQYCKNLIELRISMDCEEDIEGLQKELEEVLPKLSNLKILWLVGSDDVQWDSMELLKNCTQIEELYICKCKTTDYSVIKNCSSLEILYLNDTQVTKAEDVIGFDKIEEIHIRNTPLSKDEKEMKKLKEAYSYVWIDYEVREEDE